MLVNIRHTYFKFLIEGGYSNSQEYSYPITWTAVKSTKQAINHITFYKGLTTWL